MHPPIQVNNGHFKDKQISAHSQKENNYNDTILQAAPFAQNSRLEAGNASDFPPSD